MFCVFRPSTTQLLNLGHDSVQLIDQIFVIAVVTERGDECAIVPKCAVLFSGEPIEHFQSNSSQLGQDRAGVMQLVRSGDEPG